MRRLLYQIYWAMERRIAPGLRYAQYSYEDELKKHVNSAVRWLDLGCGHHVLPTWRFAEEQELVRNCGMVVGADVDIPSLVKHRSIRHRVACEMSRLSFPSESFDLVTANMVVEHLSDPRAQFAEVGRVLKSGGIFIFHTVNRRGYKTQAATLLPERLKGALAYALEGRHPDDVFPTYYRANTSEQIAEVAAATGFQVLACHLLTSSAQFVVIPPLAFVELLWIRRLMKPRFADRRTNIIAVLQKRPAAPLAAGKSATYEQQHATD